MTVTQFKVEQENERLRQAQELSAAHLAAAEEYRKRKTDMEQRAQLAQRKLDEIAPQVDDFERWAQQLSGELETVSPEIKGLESAKSYREKKAKPFLVKVIDVLKALYREFLALKNRYFALEKQYHRVVDEKDHLSNALTKIEPETRILRKDAGDFQRVKRFFGPKEVEKAFTIMKGEICMRRSFFEETGGTYLRAGGCLLPNLVTGTHEHTTIGVWGWRHLKYIHEYRPILYNILVLNGKLNSYLAEIEQQARDRLDTIIQQAAQAQGITEELKAADPMTWVGKMNNIRCAAEEIISKEIIFL